VTPAAKRVTTQALVRSGLVVAVTVFGPVMVAVRGIARVEIGVELRADREHREHHHQGGGADREARWSRRSDGGWCVELITKRAAGR